MGHNHDHSKQKNIKVAFLLNFSFTILEIIGGIWTNSIAIISDALHDLGDSISLGLAWYLERYSEREADEKFSFGYARFSLLGALVNSLILVGGSVLILTRAIPRIINPESVNSKGMLVFAIIGIVVNGAAVLKLKSGTSLNEKVVSWHLLEDVLGWVVLLIASIVLMYVDFPQLDPILSIFITLYVLYNVVRRLKDILNIFLQGVPEGFSIKEVESKITQQEGIISTHHTHIWSLEGEKILLSTHIIVKDNTDWQIISKIKNDIKENMKEKGVDHVTIEVDFESEVCKDSKCDEKH